MSTTDQNLPSQTPPLNHLLSATYTYTNTNLSTSSPSPPSTPFTHTILLPAPLTTPFTSNTTSPNPSITIPSPSPSSTAITASKVAYLSLLRKAVVQIQEAINIDLTRRMAEDVEKTRAVEEGVGVEAGKGAGGKGRKGHKKMLDEAREEENYGEEVVEDD